MITKYFDINSIEYLITDSYVEGKGYIFGMFFGWRRTKNDIAEFLLSKKDWEKIDTEIKYYYTFIKK